MLFRAMFSARKAPMNSMPFHCFCSVAMCSPRKAGSIIIGASARKLNAMCETVINSGNAKPARHVPQCHVIYMKSVMYGGNTEVAAGASQNQTTCMTCYCWKVPHHAYEQAGQLNKHGNDICTLLVRLSKSFSNATDVSQTDSKGCSSTSLL